MAENFSNTYQTTLNDSGGISAGDTSMIVTSATGSPDANFRVKIEDELILVTAKAGTTFTITRGIEGTTAATHADGSTVTHVLTAAVVQGISDRLTLVHLTADETGKTDANLVDTSLFFELLSGVYYQFRFDLIMRTTGTTVGFKIGLTYPAMTVFAAEGRIPILDAAAATSAGEVQGAFIASGNSMLMGAADTINTDYLAQIMGSCLPSANGTLMVQYAAETTGATVTLRQGSTGELIKHT